MQNHNAAQIKQSRRNHGRFCAVAVIRQYLRDIQWGRFRFTLSADYHSHCLMSLLADK